ncbi:DegT/DnrJ/EryC1/StrS family aminotransferase [Aquimarina sp. AD10]|uniref:DegT/DnrJ/EryC1/StrS family aminotransferase n=1 Tax=Aquimarina sp. AD10 TaxID=1714849 RepID=UPI000E4A9038|nr:DegT/DnrJ/EryC1/StrS family aminotransferase [Aquimarina sp. AD10]AXT61824.1 DegT/DnrJ/EryC1/StrS family aminotransferase [Aquimarina sp. AD10]RKN02622.1 aminotransferase class I/II-fold pyridoxal phosphate-dependent enzyme [Aquimarina sp. AD10]
MIKFLDLQHQYKTIKKDIDTAIENIITTSAFIGGEELKKLEKNFASFQGAKHCIGVANGTDALEIAIEALDLPPNSDIIVPANSFIASSEAVTRSGHKVVFCDCNLENYTISIDSLKKLITKSTKAIIAVHLYGHPCDMGELLDIAKEHDLRIIEDCAQAHGAEYKGKRIGAIGDIGTFSFYPGKNLGAYGDGGAIVTNNEELAIKCKMIANHGRVEKYNHVFEGRNSRLDNLQAAILNVKLKHLENWTNQRIKIADFYLENLKDVSEIVLPKRSEWARQVYHLFVIRTDRREELKAYLGEQNIQTGIHYPIALPKLKAYDYVGHAKTNFNANNTDTLLLSLPIGEHLTLDDAEIVVEAIKNFF